MPQPPTLKIKEIFASIQGEGLRCGEPTFFIRLAGCNLRCPWCDTKYAWRGGKIYTVDEILHQIEQLHLKWPINWVCLTGGEPLLQDIKDLVLVLKKAGFCLQLETNATLYQNLAIDWWTISPKPPDYFFQNSFLTKAKEIKLVVSSELNLPIIKNIREAFPSTTPIILQPQSNYLWSRKKAWQLLAEATEAGLTSLHLGLQLHKIFRLK